MSQSNDIKQNAKDDGRIFGFTASYYPPYELKSGGTEPGTYSVYLPHMCDEWMISESPDKQVVISQLEKFIAEAQTALSELKQLEPSA